VGRHAPSIAAALQLEDRNMLLWIAVVGASLGAYSLSLAPFSPPNERSQREDHGDD
jgi:hypothetical protein